jgi:hypothetical protein
MFRRGCFWNTCASVRLCVCVSVCLCVCVSVCVCVCVCVCPTMAKTVLSRVLTFVQNNDLVDFHAFMCESNMSPNGFLPSGEQLASVVMFNGRPLLCTYLFNCDGFDPHQPVYERIGVASLAPTFLHVAIAIRKHIYVYLLLKSGVRVDDPSFLLACHTHQDLVMTRLLINDGALMDLATFDTICESEMSPGVTHVSGVLYLIWCMPHICAARPNCLKDKKLDGAAVLRIRLVDEMIQLNIIDPVAALHRNVKSILRQRQQEQDTAASAQLSRSEAKNVKRRMKKADQRRRKRQRQRAQRVKLTEDAAKIAQAVDDSEELPEIVHSYIEEKPEVLRSIAADDVVAFDAIVRLDRGTLDMCRVSVTAEWSSEDRTEFNMLPMPFIFIHEKSPHCLVYALRRLDVSANSETSVDFPGGGKRVRETLLAFAARSNDNVGVEILLQHGARHPDVMNADDVLGHPLCSAYTFGNVSRVMQLLDGGGVVMNESFMNNFENHHIACVGRLLRENAIEKIAERIAAFGLIAKSYNDVVPLGGLYDSDDVAAHIDKAEVELCAIKTRVNVIIHETEQIMLKLDAATAATAAAAKRHICDHCGVMQPVGKEDFKRCKRCHLTRYCSRLCQRLDWSRQHSVECVPIRKRICAGCKKRKKTKLKSCTRCRDVRYCSRACQYADWPVHKVVCVNKDI